MLAVIAALAGAIVGGLITEVRSWLQTRRENTSTLNRVLYTQLDVWHTVANADPGRVLAAIPRIMASTFRVPVGDLAPLFRRGGQLHLFLTQLLSRSISEGLGQKYQSAVDALAGVNPLLAFQLSGRPELNKYTELWKSQMESLLERIHASESDRQLLASLQPIMEEKTRASLLRTLEGDILDVAGGLGYRVRKQVQRVIAKSKRAPEGSDEAELSELLEELLRSAIAPPSPGAVPPAT